MARSHTYSRSPAIFLYFWLFSTCCELLDLNTYLNKQASLRYAVCDPASSEAAESSPSNVSYLVDSRHLCWRFRRRRFFSARLSHTPTSISSFQLSNLFISGDVQVNIQARSSASFATGRLQVTIELWNVVFVPAITDIKCGEVKYKKTPAAIFCSSLSWSPSMS